MAGLRAEVTQPYIEGPGIEETILSPQAVQFLYVLHQRFAPRRKDLLTERLWRQRQFDRGHFPEFLPGKDHRHDAEWTVAPIPRDLLDQKVMVAGAPGGEALSRGLKSDANALVADFDDCASPVWTNCLEEQTNLREANDQLLVRHAGGSPPASKPPALFLRPRNWLLEEKHFSFNGTPISASLFDFGAYFFHNATTLLAAGSAPRFSLPKLEGHLEARLWNDIFSFSEEHLGIPHGSIRAIVTIETLSAAFEMEEILFELRDYAFALGCSPSNYLASYIQALRVHGEYLLPQCSDLSMEQPFLHAYRELLVHTCHKRGAYAIGACYPQLPVCDHSRRNQWAKTAARVNAMHEAEMGFDGTTVSDADLVPAVVAAIAEQLKDHRRPIKPGKDALRRQCYISSSDLISRARGRITAAAVKENVEAALGNLEAWLSGRAAMDRGARAGSMATAELCRAQLWQWIRHSARLAAGHKVDKNLVECLIRDFSAATAGRLGAIEFAASGFSAAGEILLDACIGDFESPLTIRAYPHLA
jgi:malate synthase